MLTPTFTVTTINETDNSATLVLEPLEKGYGHTLGNSLRRSLLDSLPGAAITEVKIKGIRHQFSTLHGMSEDIVELILNLKALRIQYEGDEPETLHLSAQGAGEVKASQIKTPPTVKIINKDLVLASLADKKAELDIEMQLERGVGYSPAEDRRTDKLGVIPIDATFTPIRQISYKVEATRVGRRTDLDRLILDITTDGTVKPLEALKQTAKLLQAYFQQIYDPKIVKIEQPPVEYDLSSEVYKLTVEELDLPTRIANALRKGGYKTVKDLISASMAELSQVKNLGEKSVSLVRKALRKKEVDIKE